MPSLPVVGGSSGTWGTELNAWLVTAHNPDGTLKEVAQNPRTSSYTLVASDAGKVVEMNVASANILTVPPNSAVPFPIGTLIEIGQYGAGQTTIAPGAGVTVRSAGAKMKITSQYSVCSLRKRGTDEWWLVGEMST